MWVTKIIFVALAALCRKGTKIKVPVGVFVLLGGKKEKPQQKEKYKFFPETG